MNTKNGFTLIELLVVIAIIAILSGTVISIINPARLQLRAKEATARTKVSKACLAYRACADSGSVCNTDATIGLQNYTGAGEGGTYTGNGSPSWTNGTCTITCAATGLVTLSGTCSIIQ